MYDTAGARINKTPLCTPSLLAGDLIAWPVVALVVTFAGVVVAAAVTVAIIAAGYDGNERRSGTGSVARQGEALERLTLLGALKDAKAQALWCVRARHTS